MLELSDRFIGVKFAHSVIEVSVLQCRNFLQGLSIHNMVQLFWVPGHCGIIGNEEADDMAGVGSKSSFCTPCLPEPRSLMARVRKEWLSSNHLSYWNLVNGCRQSQVWIKLARLLRNLPRTRRVGTSFYMRVLNSGKPKNADFR
jgi:hypothetical protein